MAENEAGIRELKAHLSAYLRRVKAGETIVITERGTPVGRIVPVGASVAEQMQALVEGGIVAWSGDRLSHVAPVAHTAGGKSVADLLLEDRK